MAFKDEKSKRPPSRRKIAARRRRIVELARNPAVVAAVHKDFSLSAWEAASGSKI